MRFVFDSEEEKERIGLMIRHGMEQIDLKPADHILNISMKNILLFFMLEAEKGDVQNMVNVTPRPKQITAPNRKGKK
jgi:hypothetical protein